MPQLHETSMGQKFFMRDFPRLTNAIAELNETLKKRENTRDNVTAPLPCALCRVCVYYNDGGFHPACRDCIGNGWGNFRHKDDPTCSDISTSCKPEFL